MIYDLSTLYDREFSEGSLETAALIAIAERLDALRAAAQPRFVEFKDQETGVQFVVSASKVLRIQEVNTKFDRGVAIYLDGGIRLTVKCTVAEVTAKIRGEA